jgi:hypothetical protein
MPCCRSSSHTHWGLELAYCLPCCAALLEAHAIIRKGSITPTRTPHVTNTPICTHHSPYGGSPQFTVDLSR